MQWVWKSKQKPIAFQAASLVPQVVFSGLEALKPLSLDLFSAFPPSLILDPGADQPLS